MPYRIPTDLNDAAFRDEVAHALSQVPGVEAVMLGGSRAAGRHSPGSDWDFSVYYRGDFEVTGVRDLGWPGEVSALGGWGGGVFNGGAWLEAGGRRVDVHYRDLADVESRIREAEKGEFAIEQLLFYLAGIPTYVVVAELALGQILSGTLPRPGYPETLKQSAFRTWRNRAEMTLQYAGKAYAEGGHRAMACGSVVRALLEAAHARVAREGIWVTNEKTLLTVAGIGDADSLFDRVDPGPDGLIALIERARSLIGENA